MCDCSRSSTSTCPTEPQAVLRFLAGDVQFTDSFAASQRPWLKSVLGDQVVNAPWLGIYMLAFNFQHAAVHVTTRRCAARWFSPSTAHR